MKEGFFNGGNISDKQQVTSYEYICNIFVWTLITALTAYIEIETLSILFSIEQFLNSKKSSKLTVAYC